MMFSIDYKQIAIGKVKDNTLEREPCKQTPLLVGDPCIQSILSFWILSLSAHARKKHQLVMSI